jgi:hypothetical protein
MKSQYVMANFWTRLMTTITFPYVPFSGTRMVLFIYIRLIRSHQHSYIWSDEIPASRTSPTKLKMKTASSSETSVTTYQVTRCHDPEPETERVSVAVTTLDTYLGVTVSESPPRYGLSRRIFFCCFRQLLMANFNIEPGMVTATCFHAVSSCNPSSRSALRSSAADSFAK